MNESIPIINERIAIGCLLLALILTVRSVDAQTSSSGRFQFDGSYYFYDSASNRYCHITVAPPEASTLRVVAPQSLNALNVGMCDRGPNAPMAYTGYNLGSGFAVSTNANWLIFNSGYFPSHNLFVDAQSGDDRSAGTAALPLRTISAAQSLVRNIENSDGGPIQVNLRGTFYLQQPLSFTAADSGRGSNFVVYRNWSGYSATISGGKTIAGSDWTPYNSAKRIYRTPIGAMRFRNLFVNNRRAHMARTQFPLTASVVSRDPGHIDCSQCVSPLPSSRTKVEIVTISMFEVSFCPGQFDPNGDLTNDDLTADTKPTSWCWSHMLRLPELSKPPHVTWLQNSLLFVKSPGDWALDPAGGYAYYIPLPDEDLRDSNIVAPQLTQLLRATSLRNVAFIGITFAHTDWQGANTASGYQTMQADELYVVDGHPVVEIPAAVTFNDGQHIIVAESNFEQLGTAGLFFGVGSNDNLIFHNTFNDISASAIQVAGIMNHAATTNQTKNTTIQDNSISHIGQEYFGSPAVFQGYAAYTVLDHNQIYETPYTGISDGWGWTTAAYNNIASTITSNLIYNGMQVLQDGGGIYTNSAQAGTVIAENYIHDLATGSPGVHNRVMSIGIYLDSGSSGISVNSNIVQNIPFSKGHVQPCGVFQNIPQPTANQLTCSTPASASNLPAGPRPIRPPP